MAAGEIRNPDRVIPQSLAWGLIAVLFLYMSANLAYFYALPFEEIVNSHSTLYPDALPVATKAALQSFGGAAVALLSLAFVFSALGAMNGTILTGARVPYAMARDGLMWKRLGEANARTHSPVWSTVVKACGRASSPPRAPSTNSQIASCSRRGSSTRSARSVYSIFAANFPHLLIVRPRSLGRPSSSSPARSC